MGTENTVLQRDGGGPQIRFAHGGKRVKAHKNEEHGSLAAPKPSLLSRLGSLSVLVVFVSVTV